MYGVKVKSPVNVIELIMQNFIYRKYVIVHHGTV